MSSHTSVLSLQIELATNSCSMSVSVFVSVFVSKMSLRSLVSLLLVFFVLATIVSGEGLSATEKMGRMTMILQTDDYSDPGSNPRHDPFVPPPAMRSQLTNEDHHGDHARSSNIP